MNLARSSAILLCLANFLGGCGAAVDEEEDCSVDGQKAFVKSVMNEEYLWYDRVPDVDIADFETPEDLLRALRYSDVDRWSRLQTVVAVRRLFDQGLSIGLGYELRFDTDGVRRISQVVVGSPAEDAGLRRGMRITAINGMPADELDAEDAWGSATGPREVGVEVEIDAEDVDGALLSTTVIKEDIQLITVPVATVTQVGGLKIAYLAFTHFLNPSVAELEEAFALFKEEGAEALVVDVRYNSGGRLNVARELASLIAGLDNEGQAFLRFEHNDKNSDRSSSDRLSKKGNGISIRQVAFLTSTSTASASEALINGLRPYLDVAIMGTRTLGKPVGANTFNHCDLALTPITFRMLNADGDGDFFDGLPTDCEGTDDLLHQLGDPQEALLSQAVMWLTTGQCAPPVPADVTPLSHFPDDIAAALLDSTR